MNVNDNSHEQLVDQALSGFDLAAEHHIANCHPCQVQRERLEEAFRDFGAANREYAQRPENFWERQTAAIRASRIRAQQRSRMTMALVPSLAVLLLMAVAMLGRAPGVRPVTTPTRAQAIDPDHELLLRVERAIQADTPLALEPATLMVDEREAGLLVDANSDRKEIRSHEN
jgi:tRNA/tmRNA/rRNA uracil-C5-methylase (TrmA/RlmC/RlmD family)